MSLPGLLLASAVLAAAAGTGSPSPGVDQGRSVAHRDCAMCHAVGRRGRSPNAAAPTFRNLSLRYGNEISLERALHEVARRPHGEMGRPPISEADVPALAAYIASLEAR